MATTKRVIEIAASQVGVQESPSGSNRVLYSNWYGLIGPWCAMFISWCFYQAGMPLPASTSKGFAYTPSGVAWFKAQKRWYTTSPKVGDVVFFDFPGDGVNRVSHVGIVTATNADGSIDTIEGNTDESGGRTGGKVMRRRRRAGIVGYGRPAYDTNAQNEVPFQRIITTTNFAEEPDMRRIDVTEKLDNNGNGWTFLPGVDSGKVVSIVMQGPYPPDDNYWNTAVAGRQQRRINNVDGIVVSFSEGPPNTPITAAVWVLN